jgi:hypothetical protein
MTSGAWRRAALAATIAAAGAWPAAALASGPTPEEAFAELNRWRAQAGIAALTRLDPTMSEGCRLHNAYLALNDDIKGLDRHAELPTRRGYSDLGARAGQASQLSSAEGGPRIWDDAVYHRLGLLDPLDTTAWFDASSGGSCMGTGGAWWPADGGIDLFPWPANGLRGVPLEFEGGENPDPYDSVPAGVEQLGYLLSVNVSRSYGVHLTRASLTPDGGAPVAVTGVDADSRHGGFLNGGFAILPHGPLKPMTWYTAAATGRAESDEAVHPFDLAWRFMTGPEEAAYVATDAPPPALRLSLPRHGRVAVTVTREGREVARRMLRDRQRWLPKLPPGEYRVCIEQPPDYHVGGDRCTEWTLMRLSGSLRKGRAVVRVRVPPAGAKRKVRVSFTSLVRKCYQLTPKRRYCGQQADSLGSKVVRVRRSGRVAIRVPRSARRVQVRATAPAIGERHDLAEAVTLLRRR